ncbi:MAG TPA: NUDIX hydrolase [Micromonosporaceae bacterium]
MTEYDVPESLLEHARRFYAEGGEPAPPRPAATVLLLRAAEPDAGSAAGPARERPEGFEVYVIRRALAMTFGGVYAFPGGRVDPTDSEIHPAWSGPTPEEWGERLGLPADAAQAVVCAAAREVFEEAGVLLAGPDADSVVGDVSDDAWEATRNDLEARRLGFAGLLAARGLTMRSDLLLPWSRWITPEFEPRRFDTYFFLALLPAGQRTRNVSTEADHTMWIRPREALRQAAAGDIAMLPPTVENLRAVAACADLPQVLAAARRRAIEPILPRLNWLPDGRARFVL